MTIREAAEHARRRAQAGHSRTGRIEGRFQEHHTPVAPFILWAKWKHLDNYEVLNASWSGSGLVKTRSLSEAQRLTSVLC